MHYERLRKGGEIGAAEPTYAIGTKRAMTTDGYVRLNLPDHPMAAAYGWALEHRVIAYDAGLLTDPDVQHVHHRDHDRTNNDLSNLEVLSGTEHLLLHGREHCLDAAPYLAMSDAGMSHRKISTLTGINTGTLSRVLRRARALR